jgi:hypothetical protein
MVLVVLAVSLGAQQPDAGRARVTPLPLDVLFIGAPDTTRSRDFLEFLGKTFRSVRFASHAEGPTSADEAIDVAVLDWSQQERDDGDAPLGARDRWTTPTVLLGSAGLNLSSRWKLRGGWG